MTECAKLRLGPPHEGAVLTPFGNACVLHVFSADEWMYINTTPNLFLLFFTIPLTPELKMGLGKTHGFGCALFS
jgi:hypothetical protein